MSFDTPRGVISSDGSLISPFPSPYNILMRLSVAMCDSKATFCVEGNLTKGCLRIARHKASN